MFDKENSLTFQNITQTMKINKSKKNGLCFHHEDRIARYRNRDNDCFYCVSCAIQEASRGAAIQDLTKSQLSRSNHSSLSLLQEVYQQSQKQIQEYIHLYNCKYQKLLEAMTDMQIRDLITFNRKIQENHSLYKSLKQELTQSWDRPSVSDLFTCSASKPIFKNIDQLIRDVLRLATSNQHKSSQIRSRVLSPIISKNSSPKPLSKNRSQNLEPEELNISSNSFQGQCAISKQNSRQSFAKSQPNTGSFQSKNSKIEETKKSSLQDTPESVKVMVSQQGIRVTNNMATTMFQKIDICESINLNQFEVESHEKESACSLKRKNRYENNQE